MPEILAAPTLNQTPEVLLENYIASTAGVNAPIPVDSEQGQRLYRALAQHVWRAHQRPVNASDVRDLWERIDTIKRGAHVGYELSSIHFWAAEYANVLCTETAALDPEHNRRLGAWLNEWPNICILGQTGRGKSSTINRLFGIKMADVSHHTACTRTVTDYKLVTGMFLNRPTGVIMWDVPGYGDERISWDTHVKLYRRMTKKCDVVIFMVDNDRHFHQDLKMFRKLKKIPLLESKLVVSINKADLFFPCNWNEKTSTPSDEMLQTIHQRAQMVADMLDLRNSNRVVPISAMKNWNIYALLTAMVDAAGDSKGASLLRAVRPVENSGRESAELGRRFGISTSLRSHFRSVIGA